MYDAAAQTKSIGALLWENAMVQSWKLMSSKGFSEGPRNARIPHAPVIATTILLWINSLECQFWIQHHLAPPAEENSY